MTALSISNFLTFKRFRFLSGLAAGIFLLLAVNADIARAQLYGDGSDGDVTIPGTTVLTSDMNYNNLTILPTGTLETRGFIVRVNGTLLNFGTIRSGLLSNAGMGGTGGTRGMGHGPHFTPTNGQPGMPGGGGPPGSGMSGGGGGGGAGGGGAWDATNAESVQGGNGGIGGNGGNGAYALTVYARDFNNMGILHSNGQAATSGTPGFLGTYDSYIEIFFNRDHAGGGGGGGGGGRGGGAGNLTVVYQNLLMMGTLQANGGAGGNGGPGANGINTNETAGSNQNEENGAFGGPPGGGGAGPGGNGGRSEMDNGSSNAGASGGIGAAGNPGIIMITQSVTCYADDDFDNFGDPSSPEEFINSCGAGYVSNDIDCDDNNNNVYPGAIEVCNTIDDDCDGIVDCNGIRGDVNNDGANANILDLNYAVNRIFRGGPQAPCLREGDVNSDGVSTNILDLNFLVNRIFRAGPNPGPC